MIADVRHTKLCATTQFEDLPEHPIVIEPVCGSVFGGLGRPREAETTSDEAQNISFIISLFLL